MIECGYWASAGVWVLTLILVFTIVSRFVKCCVVRHCGCNPQLWILDFFQNVLVVFGKVRVIMGQMESFCIPGSNLLRLPDNLNPSKVLHPVVLVDLLGTSSRRSKTWWMILLSVVFLLIAMDSSIVHFYMRSDFGAFALNTGRYSTVISFYDVGDYRRR